MLKPADGIEGVKKAILETVDAAGPNACPPLVVGVGIGGDFEKCGLLIFTFRNGWRSYRMNIP